MTIKQKYNEIDQSKLPKSIIKVLKGIEKKTNSFTDLKANRTFESKIDTIRKGLKKKYPEALDKSKPKDDSKAKSASEKIKSIIDNDPVLKGIRGTDIARDKERKAKASGKRISKAGNIYYEYRENRTDRYAPEFPKNRPFLEKGGKLDEITEAIFFGNASGGKMETSFGEKTMTGVMEMIRNVEYSAKEIAEALFGSTKKTDRLNTGWGAKSFDGLTSMINKARKNIIPQKLEDGGLVYIDFLNSKKGFQKDRKHFNSYEDAEKWAKDEFEKFHPDMINYMQKGGATEFVYTDLEILPENISESTTEALNEFLSSLGLSLNKRNNLLNIEIRHKLKEPEIANKVRNWLKDNFVHYDYGLPFESGGIVRGFNDLNLADQNEIDDRLGDNISYWFDMVGVDMPEELEGDEYETQMDVARDEMAKQGYYAKGGKTKSTTDAEGKTRYVGKGTKVKYPEASKVGTVMAIEKSKAIPNEYEVEVLYDDGKKVNDGLSSFVIVEDADFEEAQNTGRYEALYLKDYIFEKDGKEIEYNGWGIFDTKLGAFTNISTDRERIPYQPAGGFSTALEIAQMQNNGQIKPEDIYIVTHKRHKFNKSLASGGIIEFDDGFKFKRVSKEYAHNFWFDQEIYGINEDEQTEHLIENASSVDDFDVFGIEEGVELLSEEMAEGGEVNEAQRFNYMLLGRLQTDNDYFLGYGGRNEKQLWAGNVDDQIAKMKELWNSFPADAKPEWLSMEEIEDYEKKMKSPTSDNAKLIINGHPYWVKRINSTHVGMSNSADGLDIVIPSHIGQYRGEPYYEDLRSWLKMNKDIDGNKYSSSYLAQGGVIQFDDGFKFNRVSKEYARENWQDEEIYAINLEDQSERVIESEEDVNDYDDFGTELGFAKGGELSDDEYIDYLNEIGEGYDIESDEWIIGGEPRLEYYPSSYGLAVEKYDPIRFNVGKRDHGRNYASGGELGGIPLKGTMKFDF